jgi:tetratricopeptide (TPR) repeat protein
VAFDRKFYLNVIILAFMAHGLVSLRVLLDNKDIDSRYTLTPPPPALKYFTFGFSESFADSLWLRYIQDMEKCGSNAIEPIDLVGENAHHKGACKNSWSFLMLNAITDIAPRFRMPYAVGPLTLSVIVEDAEGADKIFEKALLAFPQDWPIQYRAAYHYLYDRHDNEKAAELLLIAAKNGGPSWLPLLASRLYTKLGQLEIGIKTLENYLDGLDNPNMRERVQKRLTSLKNELACQGSGQKDCPTLTQ